MTSGSYTYNFASGSVELRRGCPIGVSPSLALTGVAAGDYTLVISTYAPGLLGPYRLHLGSTGRFDLDPIPQEGAGMYTKIVRGEWWADALLHPCHELDDCRSRLGETAAGGPSSGRYASNPTYRLRLPHAGQLKIRLQLVSTSHSAPLNATLFSSSASGITTAGALGKHVLTSGPFADIRPGVVTPQASLAAGTYLLVPSAFASGFEAKFKIVVYSSVSGVVLDLVDK
jgi:calpain-7